MNVFTSILGEASQQDKVLNAINNSVSSTVDPVMLYGGLGAVAFVLIGAALFQKFYKPAPTSGRKVFRNSKKLLKEAARELSLSNADLKKLHHHANRAGAQHSLTLLLCPSLMRKKDEPAGKRA